MTSSRPYFLRAIYDWLVDNGLTPHLLVNAEVDGVTVPAAYVENGQVVLNIGPSAVRNLDLGNQTIAFDTRFGGTPMHVEVPQEAVLGIYARENGRGMLFPDAGETPSPTPPGGDGDGDPDAPPAKGRPRLRVVK